MSIIIESEQSGTVADLDIYLFRLLEPHVTGHFATLVHVRVGDQWHLIWYPYVSSNRVQSS